MLSLRGALGRKVSQSAWRCSQHAQHSTYTTAALRRSLAGNDAKSLSRHAAAALRQQQGQNRSLFSKSSFRPGSNMALKDLEAQAAQSPGDTAKQLAFLKELGKKVSQ
jgi:hypothetical protein